MDSNPSDERGILNTSGLGTGTARGPLTADDIIAAFEAIERSFDDNPCHPRNGGITGQLPVATGFWGYCDTRQRSDQAPQVCQVPGCPHRLLG